MWPNFAIDLVGGLLLVDCLWLILSRWRIQWFLRSTPELETLDDIQQLKSVLGQCSCCNLLFAISLFTTFSVFTVAIFSGMAHPDDFDRLFYFGILRIGVVSLLAGNAEGKLKDMPAGSQALRAAHGEIMRRWEGNIRNL